jgi:membrane associated rhomboid family serine protease
LPLEERYKKRMVLGQEGNHLVNLIMVLSIVFIIFKLLFGFYYLAGLKEADFENEIMRPFILPADLSSLASRPWTVLTYMFMHIGVFHFIGNMLWLWAFGFIMQDLAGNGKIIPVFLYGGLAGAFFFVLSYNVFPRLMLQADAQLLGASGGVMAVAVATTRLAPNYRIFPMLNGGVPLWVLTVIFVIIDFASLPISNTGGHIAHLAGAGMGLLFADQLRRGRDWSTWLTTFFEWVANLFNPQKKSRAKVIKHKHFYKVGKTSPYKKVPHVTQRRIDDILDKINQKGYRSLSDEEKEILKRASEGDNL